MTTLVPASRVCHSPAEPMFAGPLMVKNKRAIGDCWEDGLQVVALWEVDNEKVAPG